MTVGTRPPPLHIFSLLPRFTSPIETRFHVSCVGSLFFTDNRCNTVPAAAMINADSVEPNTMSDTLFRRQRARGADVSPPPTQYSKTTKRVKKGHRGRQFVLIAVAILVGSILLLRVSRSKSLRDEGSSLRSQGDTEATENSVQPQICINDPSDMPEYWQPLPNQRFEDSGLPWSKEEQALADEAVEKGLDELVNYYDHNMTTSRINDLNTDAVNSLIDEAYGSGSMPSFHQKALLSAARVLKLNAAKFMASNSEYKGCTKTYQQLKYVGYGQYLVNNLPDDKELQRFQKALVHQVNDMIRDCETLEDLMDVGNPKKIFKKKNAHADDVFEWVLGAIALTDCLTVPGLHLPEGTEEFIANVWNYLQDYHWPYARDHPKHFDHYKTVNTAWVATHVAYIPTGYGRHKQLIEDAPWLYQYVRENYYYALEYGMLDLFSEFIDLVRQYGCTEENDYQVRHGTRYILSLYEQGGRSWMNHRESHETGDAEITDYLMIHKPWTAISGVIRRQFEPIVPGSYGYAFQEALEKAGKTTTKKKKKRRRDE